MLPDFYILLLTILLLTLSQGWHVCIIIDSCNLDCARGKVRLVTGYCDEACSRAAQCPITEDVYRVSRGKSLLNSLLPMNPSSTQNVVGSSVARMSSEFISLGEALKLIPPFKGDKQEVLAFIGNVDTAFTVINPEQEVILYKFVLTRISGEPRTAITHRNLDSWVELKEFLQNSYIEKRTLDFHASQLFKAKQGKDERVTDWIHKIQTLGSQFREVALLNCSEGAREGILDLADQLRNICFIQGLASDRIQTIV